MINLVKNTIKKEELEELCHWILDDSRLTKGILTEEFEQEWSSWLGRKNSALVSSGSSANLAAFYALKVSGRLRNNKVILPTVAWSTTISPAIQLGFEPILCDCNMENLGLDLESLYDLIDEHDPGMIVAVNVLGFANNYEEISKVCKERNILLLEDSCESVGTLAYGKKTGCFGDISTFSFYYGHHMSTIEGGMICTDDEELADIIKSIRSHGWDRDLSPKTQQKLRTKYEIDDFHSSYTFYYPGFNMRCTEIQAFLGLSQLKKINSTIEKRYDNFKLYQDNLEKLSFLSLHETHEIISNFAYPIISSKFDKISKALKSNNIEHRPLIVGSIAKQPFWIDRYGSSNFKNADLIHKNGMYVPNNQDLSISEIEFICDTIKESVGYEDYKL